MSDDTEELVLEHLRDIKKELGSQSTQLNLMDDAIRGPRDASKPGLVQKTAVNSDRLDRIEKGAAGTVGGVGVGALIAAGWSWLKNGG